VAFSQRTRPLVCALPALRALFARRVAGYASSVVHFGSARQAGRV